MAVICWRERPCLGLDSVLAIVWGWRWDIWYLFRALWIKIISVCRDGSGPSVNIPIIVTSLMSRRATNPSFSPWCSLASLGQSSLFAQKIECYLIVLKVFCIIVKLGHDTGLGRIHEPRCWRHLDWPGLSGFYCQSRLVSSWFNPISTFEIKHVLDKKYWHILDIRHVQWIGGLVLSDATQSLLW